MRQSSIYALVHHSPSEDFSFSLHNPLHRIGAGHVTGTHHTLGCRYQLVASPRLNLVVVVPVVGIAHAMRMLR
jgi:hypothetical protein